MKCLHLMCPLLARSWTPYLAGRQISMVSLRLDSLLLLRDQSLVGPRHSVFLPLLSAPSSLGRLRGPLDGCGAGCEVTSLNQTTEPT